jgi:LysM repeat protein
MVRNGDSMDKVADKFNTTSPAIRVANLMADNNIRPGDRLIIPTHA